MVRFNGFNGHHRYRQVLIGKKCESQLVDFDPGRV